VKILTKRSKKFLEKIQIMGDCYFWLYSKEKEKSISQNALMKMQNIVVGGY